MVGWDTRIRHNYIKDESNYGNSGVLETVEIWAPRRHVLGGSGHPTGRHDMNKVLTFNVRDFNGAMALLHSIARDNYIMDTTTRDERGVQRRGIVVHDGIRLENTREGHQNELRLALRAVQTVLIAQGLGWLIGIAPDQERNYLREMPAQYRTLLEGARRGDREAEARLVRMMAQDRRAVFAALERVQEVYWMRGNRIELPPYAQGALRRFGFGQQPTYLEMHTQVSRLSDGMSRVEQRIVDARLAYLERQGRPIALTRRP
jgi:hypothetical protein